MSDKNKKACTPISIGGQAVIEGVMMTGPEKMATAVRKSDGEIVIDIKEKNSFMSKYKLNKIPILRGFLAFFVSMFTGVSCLMFSAKQCDLEEDGVEMSKFEKWVMEKFGDKIFDIIMYISVVISLVLGIGLFMVLPKLTVEWVSKPFGGINEGLSTLIEGIIRLVIFLAYIILISQMKDIRRVFEYHGAEHKTIFAYEYGYELTPENVKKQKRFHPRCGTSFLFLVMIISVIVFLCISAFAGNMGLWEKVIWRLATLPLIAGISYECIKFAGRHDNWLTKIISAPGMWLQKFTTREPDESQIEVAIAAFNAVLPENKEEIKW